MNMQAAGFDISKYTYIFIQFKFATAEDKERFQTSKETGRYDDIELVNGAAYDGPALQPAMNMEDMDASAPSTAPVMTLDPSSLVGGDMKPTFFDKDILVVAVAYKMKYDAAMYEQHKMVLAYVMNDIKSEDTDLTLYLRHDKGSDTSTEYTNVSLYGYNIGGAISAFRQITGKSPAHVIVNSYISEDGATMPEETTPYSVEYKYPTQVPTPTPNPDN
jgi:hypothetical protein